MRMVIRTWTLETNRIQLQQAQPPTRHPLNPFKTPMNHLRHLDLTLSRRLGHHKFPHQKLYKRFA